MPDASSVTRPLTIRLFGDVDVQVDGHPLPRLRARTELWLLALLVLQAERPVTRAWVAQTLWPFPDHSVDQARYNLRRGLTNLRKALGAQAYRLQSPIPSSLRFDLHEAAVDVLAFDSAINSILSILHHTKVTSGDIAALKAALDLYTAPLLPECTATWAIAERVTRTEHYLSALKIVSAHALSEGDYENALTYLRRAVAADPLWEPAQRALMETLAQSGDVSAALETYQEFVRLLHHERDSVPGDETTALYHTLRARLRQRPLLSAPLVSPADLPPTASPIRRLPVPLTTLIGRNAEIKEIETRFRQTRLLTLTGAGGVGKTRLAIQMAEDLAEEFRDGICFVDMAALTDATQVVQMTAAALEVSEAPEQPLVQTLVHFLRPRQLLLILDNCEHLSDACAQLTQTLLQGCRALRILTTSRQSLGVSGESFWRVPSLAMGDAPQLFVARAMQVQPAFRMTPDNAPAILQICQQLDGIPLALELAAARVSALPVEQIAARLTDRFALLTSGPRAGLSRQQTLEAAIKWSFDLLAPPDRAMLCALAVFVGGWTLEAAEAVAGSEIVERDESKQNGSEKETFCYAPSEVLDMLTRLVDRSVVIFENENGRARYRLLETVRQYCREKLQEKFIVQTARERHLDFFLDMAVPSDSSRLSASTGAVEPSNSSETSQFSKLSEASVLLKRSEEKRGKEKQDEKQGEDQAEWLARLELEHDNLRTALEWSTTNRQPPEIGLKGLTLAAALWRFWHRRGYLSLGRRYLARALEATDTQGSSPARARAYNGAGMLAFFQGDVAAAQQALESSLAIGSALGDNALRAQALHSLGQMTWNRRDYARAQTLFKEALTLQRTLGNRTQTAITLNYLGVVASDEGNFAAARGFLEESLAIGRDLGDKMLIANSLHSLAHMALYQDDYASARTYYGEELKLARSLHNRDLTATALHRLGSVELADQHFEAAQRLFEESLSIARALGYRDLVSAVVFSLGHALRALGDYDAARRGYEERLRICEEVGDRLGLSYALDAVAGLLVTRHEARRAIPLFAAAQALRTALVSPASRLNQLEHPHLQAAQSTLGEPEFTRLWEEGQTLTQDEALHYALLEG